jgi:hypothetical protein
MILSRPAVHGEPRPLPRLSVFPSRPLLPVRALLAAVLLAPAPAAAQALAVSADSSRTTASSRGRQYWRDFTAGAATSLLLHEAAHVVTSLALGARPSFGFDRGRPTVYSGIDPFIEPRKQFLFSGMGLDVQALLDEAILDVPHHGGSAFERGILASGVGTALFYVTIGRSASVSDIDFMSRTSSLSKADLTIIYGGVALLHAVRIHHDGRYTHFFVRPSADGGLRLGVQTK